MKTTELQGAALDWAVAKCEGFEIVNLKHGRAIFIDPADDGALNEMPINYSTNWALGGPIIERERIELLVDGDWRSRIYDASGDFLAGRGSTPLIAAMRCFVSSKVGDEIEVPGELQGERA